MRAIPVTIVTGFLGSGKTTLLSGVLSEPSMKDTAVLVNEFGEVGLDHHLLRPIAERTMLLGNGCLCCAKREDLISTLQELLDLHQRGEIPELDRVVIETSGLAEPAPILYTIFTDPVLQHHFSVDLVITTVDALNGEMHLDRNPESIKQVVAADKILITKTDIAKPQTTRRLLSRLGTINPSAQILEASFGRVEAGALFRPQPEAERGQETKTPPASESTTHEMSGAHSISLTFKGAVDWGAFGIWLSMLLHAHGEDVLRVKGLLDVGDKGPVVLNGVQHVIHPPQHLQKWPDGEQTSRVIFITEHIRPEEILGSLQAFHELLGAHPVQAEHSVPLP